MFSSYLRLHLSTSATDRDVVRAAHNKILKTAWHNPAQRNARKGFYRAMLEQHRQAQHLHLFVITGER